MELDHQRAWEELQSLFHLAVDEPDGAIDSVLLRASADPHLRAQARAIVLAARSFRGEESHSNTLPSQADERRFRGYKVLRLLGTGGSASVYLVERLAGSSTQQVALKVFNGIPIDDVFRHSFAREEFVLASLDHPNIPWLLDVGVSDAGEPFLVMEYAHGEPLDTFCDSRRLSLDERLHLILRICDTISYAHRNLVLHLDLKPSNILASDHEPTVKLLDFGTSRLLDPNRTMTVAYMATPNYASPEQLRGETLTTSADIYSLGAILFELLSGRKANSNRSAATMIERSFREAAPDSLDHTVTEEAAVVRGLNATQLKKRLQGDLATIVAKCMDPAADKRYLSVDALSDDIKMYMDGRPIRARPQSKLYRFGKFMRRNRKFILIIALAIACVVASVGYAFWRQRQALKSAERAVAMQHFMSQMFGLAHHSATGKADATVTDLLRMSARDLPLYISDLEDQREARLSIAESMALDDDDKDALPLFMTVLADARARGDDAAIVRSEYGAGALYLQISDEKAGNALLADAFRRLPRTEVSPELRLSTTSWYVYGRSEQGERGRANLQTLRSAIDLANREHASPDELASAWNILGILSDARGALDDAQYAYERALFYDRQAPESTCAQGDALKYLGHVKRERKDDVAALSDFQQSYELEKRCSGAASLQTLSSLAWVATSLADLHRWQEVVDSLTPVMAAFHAAASGNTSHLRLPLGALTRAFIGLKRYSEAESVARQELASVEGKVPKHSSLEAVAEGDVGKALLGERRFDEAATMLRSCLADYPQPTIPTPSTKSFEDRMKLLLSDAENRRVPASL